MEFDLRKTAAVFVIVIAAGIGGLIGMDVMPMTVMLMMVAPSMIAFGLLMLGLGVKHGEYRAAGR
jgi:ABC-type Na+ efflux pump permease subunit